MGYLKLKNPSAFIIKKQVVRVEKLIGVNNKFKSATFTKKLKLNEVLRREEAERKIEAPSDEKSNAVSSKFKTPKLGFLDTIKNFISSILFGSVVLKLLPYLPQLKDVAILAFKAGNFVVEFGGTLLNALATFITKVYQIVDFGKQQAKLLGGDKGLQNYENMLGTANKVLNSMFIAGMLFSDLIELKAETDSNQQTLNQIGQEVSEQVAKRQGFRAALQAAAGRVANIARVGSPIMLVGLASSILGELTFQQRKFTQNLEKQVASKLEEAKKDKNPFTKTIKLLAYYSALPGLKFYNFISTAVGSLLDIIGTPFRYLGELINFGIMSLSGDAAGIQKQKENLAKFDARVREQFRQITNTLSFGLLAKEKGSWGNIYGNDKIQREMMGKMYGGGSVKKFASGGYVREGEIFGGEITREGKKEVSRIVEIPVSPLDPGADVGGKEQYISPATGKPNGRSKIETFFPNLGDPKIVNPYTYLKNSYNIASSTLSVKPFTQVPIKMMMGDSPSGGDYTALATATNNLFNSMLENTLVPGSKKRLLDEVGSIDILNWLKSNISESIETTIGGLLDSLRYQFGLKSGPGGGAVSPSAQEGPGAGDNPLSQFGGQAQFVIGDSIAHGFAGRSGNGSDADDTKVGRSAAKVLEILKTRGDKLKGMLIDLSTGIANSPGDLASVEAQLSYLKSMGARVRVLGVSNSFSEKNGGLNQKLEQMAKKYGFYFYGGYKGGADGVHGTATDYAELKEKIKRDSAAGMQGPGGPTTSLVPSGGLKGLTDADWNELAYIVSGEAGPGDDRYGVAANVLTRVASPAWPNTIRAVGRQGGQYEAVYKGMARYDKKLAADLKKNQGKIAAALIKLNGRDSFKGRSEYANMGPGDVKFDARGNFYHYASQRNKKDPPPRNPDQSWRKWIATAKTGGYVDKTQMVLTHPGEYVIDADSVMSLGINFYDIVNKTETVGQRKRAAENLISILSQYTEDGFPETEEDYTYYTPERDQIVSMPQQIIPIGTGGGFGASNEGEDPSQDFNFMM